MKRLLSLVLIPFVAGAEKAEAILSAGILTVLG